MSVEARHLGADLDPVPIVHFDADPDLDWHQNNVDPHADLTLCFTQVGKLGKIFLLLFLVMPVYKCFLFSSVAHVSILDSILKLS
jgi:hypothetical protein